MLRLLVLTESLSPTSGWGTYSLSLIRALESQGVDIEVLSAERARLPIQLPGVHDGLRPWLRTFFDLRVLKNRPQFEVVHSFVEPYAKLSRALPHPQVVTVHGTFAQPAAHGPRWAQYAFHDGLRHSEAIVAVSDYTRDHLPADVKDRTHVIPNGIELAIQTEAYEAPSHSENRRPLIFSVGALKPRKGFDDLIKGFAVFIKKYPRAQLIIAGDDSDQPTRAKLEEHVHALDLAASVRLLGRVTRAQLLGWYRACDVFALTPASDRGGFEGFGLVYLEANAFGKPCVGTVDSGAAAAILEGVTGVLIPSRVPSAVAEGLQAALRLPTGPILEHVRKQSWDVRAKQYLTLYQSLAQSQRRVH